MIPAPAGRRHTILRYWAGGAVIFLLSCRAPDYPDRQNSQPELEHSGVETTQLDGTVLSESSNFALPTDIAIVGRFIVVLDVASDSVFHVVDRESGDWLGQFGKRGEDSGEFSEVWSVNTASEDTSLLWIYDIDRVRLTQVDVRASLRDSRLTTTRRIQLDAPGTPTGPLFLDSERIASLGFFPDERICMFDTTGAQIFSYGAVPPGDPGTRPGVRQHAYQSTMVRHPTRPLLAALTRRASQIEVYGNDFELLLTYDGPLPFRPQYRVESVGGNTSLRADKGSRAGYVDATASGEFLYGLFSGRTFGGYPSTANFGRFVHCFRWEGEFGGALEIDAEVLSVAIDASAQKLYAVRHTPTPAVVEYHIEGCRPAS